MTPSNADSSPPEPPSSEPVEQPIPSTSDQQNTSSSEKVDPVTRFLAMLIDGLLAGVLGVVPVVGAIAGAVYLVVRDGLDVEFMNQRSVGKHVMNLRVIQLKGKPMDVETSVRRNWMWGLGAIPGILSEISILGWFLIPIVSLAALAIALYEGFRVLTDPEGRRWGDEMAETKVVSA